MKKILSIGLVILAAALFFWFRSTKDAKPLSDVLIVGTSADFPPFSFRGSDDSITGFDIDIVKEVAQRLGMKVDIQDKPFTTLLPQIELGQIHVIAAGMTPTEERAKRVTFTKPYLSSNPLLVVTRSQEVKPTSLEDLKGKTILVNTGYTADLYLSSLPALTLQRLPKVVDALTALEQGRADAFVTASNTLLTYVKEGDTRFNFLPLKETDESSALALSKELTPAFFKRVQETLDAMDSDGTLATLKKKWNLT